MDRNYLIDYIKFIAIFLVVGLHSLTYSTGWVENTLIVGIISYFPRWVIPFFFIISGYLLGAKIRTVENEKNEIYFKRHFLRLVSIFVTWFLFYFVYDLVVRVGLSFYLGNEVWTEVLKYLQQVVHINILYYGVGVTSFHLWFLTALIWSIVILFLFVKFNRLNLLIIISFILNLIGLFGQAYEGFFYLPFETKDALFFGLFYTTLGYYIGINSDLFLEKVKKVKSRYLYTFLFICSVIQVIEREITFKMLDEIANIGEYYLSTIPMSICLLLLVLKHREFGKNNNIAKFGKGAVGIYITHMFILSLITLGLQFFDWEFIRESILVNIIIISVTVITSYYFYYFVNKLIYRIRNLLFM